jgi:uncharacterized membrane protein YbaN (DUF454 family)
MARLAWTLIGLLSILYGIVAAISPLPAGVVLIVLGLFIIAGANPAARPLLRRLRRRFPRFDGLVRRLSGHAPLALRKVIAETAPEPAAARADFTTTAQ